MGLFLARRITEVQLRGRQDLCFLLLDVNPERSSRSEKCEYCFQPFILPITMSFRIMHREEIMAKEGVSVPDLPILAVRGHLCFDAFPTSRICESAKAARGPITVLNDVKDWIEALIIKLSANCSQG